MKTIFFRCFLVLASALSTASATVRYVDLNCPTPTAPYTNWLTAATNIQAAVDAANTGDLVLVTNGVYASGARPWPGSGVANRLLVIRAVTIQSVNGPEQTIIQGWQVPGATNGPSAIRCVYVTAAAVLSGFTLTNGATAASTDASQSSGGGVWAASSSGATLTNCVITGNSAAFSGGGVYGSCSVNNCLLKGNSAVGGGGGASTPYSGGVIWLDNSRVIANSAQFGGGLNNVDAHGSVVSGNSADTGGGAYDGRLVNCTVTHNKARAGGGTSISTLVNSIVYFNSGAAANYDAGTVDNCCTTPLPLSGTGNITLDPQLASSSYLSAGSPCRGAGDNRLAKYTDIDGDAWQHPPSIGCDEYTVGAVTGALSVAISAAYTNVAVGFPVELAAVIDGRTAASVWSFNDGTTLSNRPYTQRAWATAGDYAITLTAYNESYPQGVDASVTIHVQTAPTHFVQSSSTNPVSPYTTWDTAATDIQSAVDAASLPGALVMVDDGVYDTGGRAVDGLMTNRVTVDKPLTVQSVNGPAATRIVGYQVPGTTNGDGAIRCAYLSSGAVLSGFTLTNGATRKSGNLECEQKGGAVWCPSINEVITNCVLTRNSAYQRAGGSHGGTLKLCTLSDNSAMYGGGAYESWLIGCMLIGNSASQEGGGTYDCSGDNCTITAHSTWGGGASQSVLNNCICYSNATPSGTVRNYAGGTLNFCCTTPLPSGGIGNFTNAPLFVDATARDFHLQTNSPCINAGANACASTATDLDGNSRIAGGTVDVGAYEFEQPLSVISYAWLQSYALSTDGTADWIDSDSDAMNNWQEWIAGTDPLNPASALRLLSPVVSGSTVALAWQSVTNQAYCVQRATMSPGPICFTPVASDIRGCSGTTSFSDTNSASLGPVLYRVVVERP